MRLNSLLALASLAVPLFAAATSASAELVEVAYQIRRPGSSGTFQPMRYTDPDDNVILLAGYSIISTHITVNYLPDSPEELAEFNYGLAVPVADAPSNFINLFTADLTPQADGTYTYDLTTEDHNGTITDSTFGYQLLGRGTYTDSFVTYTVAIPEPTAAAMLALPAAALLRRRRR